METTKEKILKALQNGERLTELTGLTEFGTTALRSRISDLRAEGYPIADEFVKSPAGKRFKAYFLPKQEQLTLAGVK